MMKRLLFITFILLNTSTSFSQVSSWRGSMNQIQRSSPTIQQNITQNNVVSDWRKTSPREYNKPTNSRPNYNILNRNPWVYGPYFDRWNMWGAPTFGWNYWTPSWYWNDWGYRQPSRIYVYENGKIDTVRGKKPIINFGIQKSTNDEIGGFLTIGNKSYFIIEYNTTFERDNSTYFPYGNIINVDFPLVDDLVKRKSFYVGVGKRVKRTGIHMMIGTVNENVLWRGKDDIGYITFPKYVDRFTTIKMGLLHDYKNITIKFDYDPVVKSATFGAGINF